MYQKSTEKGRLRFKLRNGELLGHGLLGAIGLYLAAWVAFSLVWGTWTDEAKASSSMPLWSSMLFLSALALFALASWKICWSVKEFIFDKITDGLLRDGKVVCRLSEIDHIHVVERSYGDYSSIRIKAILDNGRQDDICERYSHDYQSALVMAKDIAQYIGVNLRETPLKNSLRVGM